MVDLLDEEERKEILKKWRPKVMPPAEPLLGGWYTEEEVEAAVKAIRDSMDWHVGFTGNEIKEFEKTFAEYIGTKYAISINGAGTGLDMAMMCLNLKPGDEVICPAINFKAAHLAILGQGGKLVFCEVDPKTLNVDPDDVEKRITPRTRAIFPVSLCGLSPPLDDLLEIAENHPHPKYGPPKVIIDAARCCGAEYRGTKVGKKGWMTIFSFHTMKIITTLGEGGMITTDDPEVAKKIIAWRQFGSGIGGWGTNYKMTKVQAAVGLVQLRKIDEIVAHRRKIAFQRNELLKDVPELTLPYEPPDCKHVYYLYPILVPPDWAGEKRDRLEKMLVEDYNVGCFDADARLYKRDQYIIEHTKDQRIPISDEISERILCPSLQGFMTEEENTYICAAIVDAVERIKQEKTK